MHPVAAAGARWIEQQKPVGVKHCWWHINLPADMCACLAYKPEQEGDLRLRDKSVR